MTPQPGAGPHLRLVLPHKLVLHRASTARFARRLRDRGEVVVLSSDAERASRTQLAELVRELSPARVTCFDVVDDWL